MRRCQRMDLTAKIRVITLSVKQTAPPIRMAASLPDLFELPSYNKKSPRTKRVADRIISNSVDILFIEKPPPCALITARKPAKPKFISESFIFAPRFSAARNRRDAVGPRLRRVPGKQASNRLSSFPNRTCIEALRFVGFPRQAGVRSQSHGDRQQIDKQIFSGALPTPSNCSGWKGNP
jgi:hypothetical protein